MITWSDIQKKRLIELDAPANDLETTFSDSKNRDLTFHDLEKKLTQHAREKLWYSGTSIADHRCAAWKAT